MVKNFVGRRTCCENCENARSCILKFGFSIGRSNGNRSTDRAYKIANMWCDSTSTNKLDIYGTCGHFRAHSFSGKKPKDVKHEIEMFLKGVFPANLLVKVIFMSVIYVFEYGKKTIWTPVFQERARGRSICEAIATLS